MGASGSKAAMKTARKFPSRAPGTAAPPVTARPSRPPPAQSAHVNENVAQSTATSSTHSPEANDSDSQPISPDFANRLQKMGIAQPNPIYSASSIANPTVASARGAEVVPNPHDFAAPMFPAATNNVTLGVLEARRRFEERAAEELEMMGRKGYQGREFLDVSAIRNILVMRERGESPADIESRLRLKPGVVSRLGPAGMVLPAS